MECTIPQRCYGGLVVDRAVSKLRTPLTTLSPFLCSPDALLRSEDFVWAFFLFFLIIAVVITVIALFFRPTFFCWLFYFPHEYFPG